MTGHQINSLVGDLVAMAQAMERLPSVEQALNEANELNSKLTNIIETKEADLEQSRAYAASLEAKVYAAEVARDDAELRFLELDERAAKAVRFLGQVQGMAVQAELELNPLKPEPTLKADYEDIQQRQPEPIPSEVKPIPSDPTVAASHQDQSPSADTAPHTEPVEHTPQGSVPMDPTAHGTDGSTEGSEIAPSGNANSHANSPDHAVTDPAKPWWEQDSGHKF